MRLFPLDGGLAGKLDGGCLARSILTGYLGGPGCVAGAGLGLDAAWARFAVPAMRMPPIADGADDDDDGCWSPSGAIMLTCSMSGYAQSIRFVCSLMSSGRFSRLRSAIVRRTL